jgi:hypothetical protein
MLTLSKLNRSVNCHVIEGMAWNMWLSLPGTAAKISLKLQMPGLGYCETVMYPERYVALFFITV